MYSSSEPTDAVKRFTVGARTGRDEWLQMGLDAGLDVNALHEGRLAIVSACEGGHISTVKLLRDAGAELKVHDDDGSLIARTAAKGHVELVKLLASWGCDPNEVVGLMEEDAMYAAVGADNLEMVQAVGALDGFNINNSEIYTPLVVHACKKAGPEVLQALIEMGMSVKGEMSETEGVEAAAKLGKIEHLTILASAGAPVNATGRREVSPLYVAAEAGQAGAVEVLVGCGAELNGNCCFGGVICGAAKKGHDDIIRMAIDMGANVNRCSLADQSPFHIAAASGHAGTLRLLAELGATTDAEVEEEDALCLAAKGGHKAAVEALLELGVTGKKDKAAALAKAGGHDDVAAILV